MPSGSEDGFELARGFSFERSRFLNQALGDVLGLQPFEVEQRSLGRLALIRAAEVTCQSATYLLIERFLRTGMVLRRATNSFEVAFNSGVEQNTPSRIVTDFRYLPYRDSLTVTRHLDTSVVPASKELADQENRERYLEVISGFATASSDDWREFLAIVTEMPDGEITPVPAGELHD